MDDLKSMWRSKSASQAHKLLGSEGISEGFHCTIYGWEVIKVVSITDHNHPVWPGQATHWQELQIEMSQLAWTNIYYQPLVLIKRLIIIWQIFHLHSWSVITKSRKDKEWLKYVACTCHVMRCFRCSFWTKGNGGSSECAWSLKLRTDCTCSNRTLAGTWSMRDLIWNSSAIFWQNKFMKIPGMKFLRMYQLEQGGKVEAQLFW